LIDDADAAALAWYRQRRYVPINHMLAVSRELAERRPEVVRAIYAIFAEAAAAAPRSLEGINFLPYGFDAVRPPVEAMIEHAVNQKIIPYRLSFNEIFGEARRVLEG
jgi:4,5-dihydroxyphthalate decarboxylase